MGSGNTNKGQKKITRQERSDRVKEAAEREARAKAKSEAAQKTKKIFTVVVCIILILALGIPTMALTVFSAGAAGA